METRLKTLSIQEALEEGNIKNRDSLPKMIGISGKALVLSDKRDCYYTTTIHGCSCDESISGVFPCCHQYKAFPKKCENIKEHNAFKLAEETNNMVEIKQWVEGFDIVTLYAMPDGTKTETRTWGKDLGKIEEHNAFKLAKETHKMVEIRHWVEDHVIVALYAMPDGTFNKTYIPTEASVTDESDEYINPEECEEDTGSDYDLEDYGEGGSE